MTAPGHPQGPYRDGDTAWFQPFAQHVAIAAGCLEDTNPLAQRFAASAAFASEGTLLELCTQVGAAWETLWLQLDQARALAARAGRDVSAYDAARAQVRDRSPRAIRFDLSSYHPASFPPGRQLAYRASGDTAILYYVPEETLAHAALAALRAAAPEVVIPEPPQSAISPLPWQARWGQVVVVVMMALLLGGIAFLALRSRG